MPVNFFTLIGKKEPFLFLAYATSLGFFFRAAETSCHDSVFYYMTTLSLVCATGQIFLLLLLVYFVSPLKQNVCRMVRKGHSLEYIHFSAFAFRHF